VFAPYSWCVFKAYRARSFPQSTATITRRSVNLVLVVVAVLVAALLPALPAHAATITSAPLTTTTSTTATFAFAGDVGETFRCSLDSSYPAACTSPITYTELTVGAHSFTVYGQAVTGGPASSDTWRWTITPPPAFTDTTISAGPGEGAQTDPTVYFSFTGSNIDDTFECALDSAIFSSCTSPHTLAYLAIGSHTFAVRARTVGGILDETPATRSFTVATAPVEPIVEAGQRGGCEGPRVGPQLRPGCTQGQVLFGSQTAFAPARSNIQALITLRAQTRRVSPDPWLAYLTKFDSAAAKLPVAKPCDSSAAMNSAAATIRTAAAALVQSGSREQAGLFASTAADEDPSRDLHWAAIREEQRLALRATASVNLAANDAGLACRSFGTRLKVASGVISRVNDGQHLLQLADGRRFYLPQRVLSGTLNGERVVPLQNVRVLVTHLGSSTSGGIGWITALAPISTLPSSAPPNSTSVSCVKPLIVPVQPTPSTRSPQIVHSIDGYRMPGTQTLHLERGMYIMAGPNKCSQSGYTLRVLSAGKVLANALAPGQSVKVMVPGKPFPIANSALQESLTVVLRFKKPGCDCKPKVIKTSSYTNIFGSTGYFGTYRLDQINFQVDTTGIAETTQVDSATVGLGTFRASAFTTPTTISTVYIGTPYLLRPKSAYAGYSGVNTDIGGGLIWPRFIGTRNKSAFRYAARPYNPILTDMLTPGCETVTFGGANCAHRLPWLDNTSQRVSQGNGPAVGGSHNNNQIYAFDFAMVEGTLLFASRAGVIGEVVEANTMAFCGSADNNNNGVLGDDEDKKADGPSNYLRIDHLDGTFSYYAHIQKDGVIPKVGDPVARGQLVGLSGNVGRSCGPHLHFQISKYTGANIYGQTAPMRFLVKDINDVVLERYLPIEGNRLTAIANP